MKLFILSLLLHSSNIEVFSDEIPDLNCQDPTCDNPESHYEWIFFPMTNNEPCPNCDFSVYVRYDICNDPFRVMHLEILGTTDIDYFDDVNTCDLCDFRDLHVHMVLRLLQYFAQTQPSGTIIHYREKSCWVQLKWGPVGGYPPGIIPPPPAKTLASAPCPGECCKYVFQTWRDGNGSWSINFINERVTQNIDCPKKGQFGLPRDCKELCDPYAWWVEKANAGVKSDDPYSIISYPNPASSTINFKIFGIEKGNYTFSVFNVKGEELSSINLVSDGNINHSLNLNNYAEGYYNYHIIKDGKVIQKNGFIVIK